jgi:spermidine synthase
VEATLRAAGLRTDPYTVREPRDTGFVLASRGGVTLGEGIASRGGAASRGEAASRGGAVSRRGGPGPRPRPVAVAGQHRLLARAERLGPSGSDRAASVPRTPTARQLDAAGERAERARIRGLPPSTLMRPRY